MLQCNWSLDRFDDVLAADMKASSGSPVSFAVAEPFLDMCTMVASRWGVARTTDLPAHGKRFVSSFLAIQH